MVKIEQLARRKIDVDHSKPLSLKNYDQSKMAEEYTKGKLHYMSVWLGRLCDLNCYYCATEAGPKGKNELSTKQVFDLISQFSELADGGIINFNGRGEPLIQPHIEDIIQHASDLDTKLAITTNATTITNDFAEFLYKNEVALNIKLQALDRDIHNKFVGKDWAFDATCQSIKNLIKAGYSDFVQEKQDNVETGIAIMSLVIQDSLPYLTDIFKFDRINNFFPMLDDLVVAGRARNIDYENQILTKKQSKDLLKEFKKIMGYTPDINIAGLCPASYGLFFGEDGKLFVDKNYFCCDAIPLVSNYKFPEMSLEEIWGEVLQTRKNLKPKFDPEVIEYMRLRNDSEHIPICYGMAKTQVDALKNLKKI